MSIFNAINASGSALTAQRLRMDVISSNIANADSTRATVNEAGEFEPYRRKLVHMKPINGQSFRSALQQAAQAALRCHVRSANAVGPEAKRLYPAILDLRRLRIGSRARHITDHRDYGPPD